MNSGPFVLDRGLWRRVLSLIVLDGGDRPRAYGVQVPCVAYVAYEEIFYSCADHGVGLRYDGSVFVKEAESSMLLAAYEKVVPWMGRPRHFAFVGVDFCYETIGFDAPTVRTFESRDEAYGWSPSKEP